MRFVVEWVGVVVVTVIGLWALFGLGVAAYVLVAKAP